MANNDNKSSQSLNNNEPHTIITDDEKSNQNTQTLLKWSTRSEHVLHFLASHKASGTLKDNKFLLKCLNYCKILFEKDTQVILINNNGKKELCDSYPSQIIISKSFIYNNGKLQSTNLFNLFENACYARARNRFIVPVIFLPNNGCIARSSTLSSSGELLLNKGNTFVINAINYNNNSSTKTKTVTPIGNDLNILRFSDIQLLNNLNIKFICDLMVEQKKKLYGMKIASSEKADKEKRYKNFYLNSMPYPGCELFKLFNQNKHNATNLMPDWNEAKNDAILNLNDGNNGNIFQQNKIQWNKYKQWDIIKLTQNYLRLIMDYLQISFSSNNNENNIGILIHCISGWDRTPLFISLIRLSLWADNIIHCKLNSSQILYLTLTYDWLLFTHQFGKRLTNGEHIFQFAFYMLQWIINDKYSIHSQSKSKTNHNRENKLMEVYALYNKIYTQIMEINTPPKYAIIGQYGNDNNIIGVNDITQYLKNIIPISSIIGNDNNNHKNNDKVLCVYEKLIGMGFNHQIAIKSAKEYPKCMEKALDYALKCQNENDQ